MGQRRARSAVRAVLAGLGVAAIAGVLAGDAVAGPRTYAQSWEQLTPEQRNRALENYRRYQKLPEGQRRQLDRSYERWRGMDERQRERVRRNYKSYRQLDRQQRKDFGRRYQQWRGRGEGKRR